MLHGSAPLLEAVQLLRKELQARLKGCLIRILLLKRQRDQQSEGARAVHRALVVLVPLVPRLLQLTLQSLK